MRTSRPICILSLNSMNHTLACVPMCGLLSSVNCSGHLNVGTEFSRCDRFDIDWWSRYILRRRCRPVISAADVVWPAPSTVVTGPYRGEYRYIPHIIAAEFLAKVGYHQL